MKICRTCGDTFARRLKKGGFANQCDDCAEDNVARHLGFNDGSLNKSTHISVYRGDDPTVRRKIEKQKNRVG